MFASSTQIPLPQENNNGRFVWHNIRRRGRGDLRFSISSRLHPKFTGSYNNQRCWKCHNVRYLGYCFIIVQQNVNNRIRSKVNKDFAQGTQILVIGKNCGFLVDWLGFSQATRSCFDTLDFYPFYFLFEKRNCMS